MVSFLINTLDTNLLRGQRTFPDFEEENEEESTNREALSKQLISYSLNSSDTERYSTEYIPENVDKVKYYAQKLNIELYLDYPEYSEDPNFPYSGILDPNYKEHYKNYYVVYFDRSNRIIREDYYENASLRHYIFNIYKNNKKTRNRITYIKESGNLATYDYFYFNKDSYFEIKEDSVVVTIRYENQFTLYYKVEYNYEKGHTYISQQYSRILEKDGVWYYYDKDSMLRRKEFWRKNNLIKYQIHLGFLVIVYYNGRGAPISKEEYNNL